LESKNIEDDLFGHVLERSSLGKKILIEFLNKSRARKFYKKLSSSERLNCEVLLMTGDDNIAERERILDRVKETTEGLVLVATQVVEAGVDIDMDIGYKNLSLLDSEEQFLGRINRSCKREGTAYFFIIDPATTIYDGDARVHSEVTLKNEEMKAILRNKDFSQYYKRIIGILKKVTGAWNELNIHTFYEEAVGKLNFAKIEERMKLIKERDHQISVYLCTTIKDAKGKTLDGKKVWRSYKKLLRDAEMDYAEKRVKLSIIRAQMNYFIYQVKAGPNLIYSDRVGDLFFIENGDAYFENGKLNREMFVRGVGEFI
jgi:CRISPR-associated endonuclease/helicase Cas3